MNFYHDPLRSKLKIMAGIAFFIWFIILLRYFQSGLYRGITHLDPYTITFLAFFPIITFIYIRAGFKEYYRDRDWEAQHKIKEQ